jgi:hypothetical protein
METVRGKQDRKRGHKKMFRQRLLPMKRRKYVQRTKAERNRPPKTRQRDITMPNEKKKQKEKKEKLKPQEKKLKVLTPHAPQMK